MLVLLARPRPAVLMLGVACAVALVAALARPARGQVWVDADHLNGKLPDWVDPAYVKPQPSPERWEARVWVAPVYRTVWRRCWCEPVYRTTFHRVWREPVVQRVLERVWVPARYEWRECHCWEEGREVIRRELVCVAPGHYEDVSREITIRPGCWETVEEKVAVSDGRFEDRAEQELVAAGHWE